MPLTTSMLTPFHLFVLFLACLSLFVSQLDLAPPLDEGVAMWRRAMILLVGAVVLHHMVATALASYKAEAERKLAREKATIDLTVRGKIPKQPNAWENVSAHPSAFLTTKDGKPRLFPFPLGKAGGETKDLWWEAGNSAHIGHFNQRETPEAREALREEMEEKEEARQKRAKKELKRMEDDKKKWLKRLSNLKLVCGIVVVGLFHRMTAVLCLAALIYYVLASELANMLKAEDEEDEEVSAVRRKKIPTTPGMAMTYLYEPTKAGGVREAGAIPVKAPSNRLLTSADNRYAS